MADGLGDEGMADAELFGDGAGGEAVLGERAGVVVIEDAVRPAELFALFAGAGDAHLHSFANQVALQLPDGAEDLKNHASDGGFGVDVFRQRHEGNAEAVELLERSKQVGHTSGCRM
jgi:hypothetical protein